MMVCSVWESLIPALQQFAVEVAQRPTDYAACTRHCCLSTKVPDSAMIPAKSAHVVGMRLVRLRATVKSPKGQLLPNSCPWRSAGLRLPILGSECAASEGARRSHSSLFCWVAPSRSGSLWRAAWQGRRWLHHPGGAEEERLPWPPGQPLWVLLVKYAC